MKTYIEINTEQQVVPSRDINAAMDPFAQRHLTSLLSKSKGMTRLFYRVQGPDDSPFKGPTLCSGHWLLTRPLPPMDEPIKPPKQDKEAQELWQVENALWKFQVLRMKYWDALVLKAKKMAGVSGEVSFSMNLELNICDEGTDGIPNFEKLLLGRDLEWIDDNQERIAFLFTDDNVGQAFIYDKNGGIYCFNANYLIPLLGNLYRLKLMKNDQAKIYDDEGLLSGVIMPMRMERDKEEEYLQRFEKIWDPSPEKEITQDDIRRATVRAHISEAMRGLEGRCLDNREDRQVVIDQLVERLHSLWTE